MTPTTSSLKNFFLDGSIFKAVDPAYVNAKKNKYKDLTYIQKLGVGFKTGVLDFFKCIILIEIVSIPIIFSIVLYNHSQISSVSKLTERAFSLIANKYFVRAVLAPYSEEQVFRGILQNVVYRAQELAKSLFPQAKFRWLTSPSFRILLVNSLFSFVHLSNLATQDPVVVFFQVGRIFFYPTQSLLYETTNSLGAAVVEHITNNGLPIILHKIILLAIRTLKH